MSAGRTTVSMPEPMLRDAIARQQEKRFSTFSDYIQDLIRRDLEAHGIELRETAAHAKPPPAPGPSTSEPYKTTSAKKKRLKAGQLRDGRQS